MNRHYKKNILFSNKTHFIDKFIDDIINYHKINEIESNKILLHKTTTSFKRFHENVKVQYFLNKKIYFPKTVTKYKNTITCLIRFHFFFQKHKQFYM